MAARRITIKIGSNVLTRDDGLPNELLMRQLTGQIAEIKKQNVQVIVVSSGAVAAGRSILRSGKINDTVAERQVLSSLGQVRLLQLYTDLFGQVKLLCAQVLVTKQDFRDRQHYLNMQNCLEALLQKGIVPIVNENDVVSITELMFTDNDELAGLISGMLNVDALYLLTSVDGLFTGPPGEKDSALIPVFDKNYHILDNMSAGSKSHFGRGGMLTKCHTAQKLAHMGIPVTIANGTTDDVVVRLHQGEKLGTFFPAKRNASGIKKWLAHAHSHAKGEVIINPGARDTLLSDHARSLLPVGIVRVTGEFRKGDVIMIKDDEGNEIGIGQARYGYRKARRSAGLKNQKPLIHYDHLYLH
jgi:glutamate 5-kinase